MFHVGNLTGYPTGNLEELFLEGIVEVMQYGVYFAIILLIAFLISKTGSGVKYILSCITAAAGLCYLAAGSVKAECMMSVMFAVLLVLIIYIYGIVIFDFPMLLLMLTAFLFPQRLFNSSFGIFGYGVIYFVIWLVLMSFAKLQSRQENRGDMAQYVLFICLSLAAFLYKSVEDMIFTAYRLFHRISREEFVLFEIGLVFFIAVAAFVLKRKTRVGIQKLPSEELRAFLYMKCMQASQREIKVRLSVQVKQDEFGYGMELVDLTRILGILFDNSIEECENRQDAFIEIGIRTQNNRVSYSIKNSIRKGHDFGHMIEQKSDKSGHKGRGLKIIRNILEGYPNITLNTLVDKEIFHQTLNFIL